MNRILSDLLAMEDLAKPYGCGLKPELRDAIEADLRFPAHAAAPLPTIEMMAEPMPDNVTRLSDHIAAAKRKTA